MSPTRPSRGPRGPGRPPSVAAPPLPLAEREPDELLGRLGAGVGAEDLPEPLLGLSRAEAEKRIRKALREDPGVQSAEALIKLALRQ